MAVVAVGVGKVIVKVPAAVFILSEPKFNTATAAFVVLLYIKAPAAVKEEGFQVTFANEIKAVLLPLSTAGGWDMVKT
jgi:hypothetical protein